MPVNLRAMLLGCKEEPSKVVGIGVTYDLGPKHSPIVAIDSLT